MKVGLAPLERAAISIAIRQSGKLVVTPLLTTREATCESVAPVIMTTLDECTS